MLTIVPPESRATRKLCTGSCPASIKLSHQGVHPRASQSRRVPCAKTVPESGAFMPLGLALSEKQIPQITEDTEKPK